MKFKLVVNPNATGGALEFHSTNKRQKAYIKMAQNNGHYYLQFHDASGHKSSFVHEVSKNNFVNENALFMPKYVYPLISEAVHHINELHAGR